jgi:hypothetical protein
LPSQKGRQRPLALIHFTLFKDFHMKKTAIFIAALTLFISAGAFAQEDLPRIAVYVTGDVPENEKTALGTRMLASLVNIGRYRGIERSNSFLAEIEKEQIKQRSGAIDDGQISELGKQFGVKFICIANIAPVYRAFQVSARIVNVETAEVNFIGDASSQLRNMKDLTQVSIEVVRKMFGDDAIPAPRKTGLSAGVGGFFASDFGGRVRWKSGEQLTTPYMGGGAYLFFDAIYAEAFVGYSIGGGKWASDNAKEEPLPDDAQRTSLNVGAFGKYPFDLGSVKAFPLLGIDYDMSMSAKLKLANGGEYAFDGGNGRHAAGALSALWVKFGCGADFDLGETLYLRAELLYGVRMANDAEKEDAKISGGGTPLPGHGLTFKAGVGVKF